MKGEFSPLALHPEKARARELARALWRSEQQTTEDHGEEIPMLERALREDVDAAVAARADDCEGNLQFSSPAGLLVMAERLFILVVAREIMP